MPTATVGAAYSKRRHIEAAKGSFSPKISKKHKYTGICLTNLAELGRLG